MRRIAGKTALITGAARGIGQATAVALARAGADVFGVDLAVADLAATAEAVTDAGRVFRPLACEVSDAQAVQRLLAETQEHGGFDILVNNAGVLPSGPFWQGDFAVWRRTLEINLLGLVHLTHSALPGLLNREEAHIVNIASIAGKFGTEGVVAYAAAKHGVVGFSSALREELRDTSVGVSWICPSFVATRLTEGVARTVLTPLVQPEAVARAVRKAIERDAAEVFVPGYVRFVVSILPALSPRLARWILRWSGASRGWFETEKKIAV